MNGSCFKPQHYLKSISKLRKKNLTQFDFMCLGLFFEFFRLISWFLGVVRVFMRCFFNGLKIGFLDKNTFALIFQPSPWWPDYGQICDTSFASASDMSPNLFLSDP